MKNAERECKACNGTGKIKRLRVKHKDILDFGRNFSAGMLFILFSVKVLISFNKANSLFEILGYLLVFLSSLGCGAILVGSSFMFFNGARAGKECTVSYVRALVYEVAAFIFAILLASLLVYDQNLFFKIIKLS